MKNNIELVNYCRSLLDQGARYWWGTFGQRASYNLLQVKRQQYPSQYPASRDKQLKKDIEEKRIVTDCSGLIKGFMMLRDNGQIVYTPSLDLGANGYYDKATEKDRIKNMPDIPGLAVWKSGHIGVYVGNGTVIEARGFNYGVVETNLSDRSFTHWLKVPGLDYVISPCFPPAEPPAPAPEPEPKTYKVKKGDTLTKIAKAHKVTLKKLIQANPQIKNPDLIYPNQIINIPC